MLGLVLFLHFLNSNEDNNMTKDNFYFVIAMKAHVIILNEE